MKHNICIGGGAPAANLPSEAARCTLVPFPRRLEGANEALADVAIGVVGQGDSVGGALYML